MRDIGDEELHGDVLTVASFVYVVTYLLRHDRCVYTQEIVMENGGFGQYDTICAVPPHAPPAAINQRAIGCYR